MFDFNRTWQYWVAALVCLVLAGTIMLMVIVIVKQGVEIEQCHMMSSTVGENIWIDSTHYAQDIIEHQWYRYEGSALEGEWVRVTLEEEAQIEIKLAEEQISG